MENLNLSKIKLDAREDGVYLILTNPSTGIKANRKDALALLEASAVKDIDFAAVNELFKSTESVVERKISSNPNIKHVNETVKVEVSRDKMQASLCFSPPLNNGSLLTVSDVYQELKKNNILLEPEDGLIQKIVSAKKYGISYEAVFGKPAIDGIDGYLEFHFNKDKKKSLKPKELEDGRVDFHDLGLVEIGYSGQPLVTAIPPVEGKDGINVYGTIIPHKRGKLTPSLPKGKNVSISPDQTQLIADVNGQILYANGKVNMWDVLEIKGNVDNTTGDIDFNGTVIIKGNVLTGFSVAALEDIEIVGVVEGANIQAGGSLLLCSGVQGADKADISAGKDITAKFIESATVTAGGNIICDSLMHCNVKCGHTVELIGKKGLLVGGKLSASESVKAKIIGSSWATNTEIEVGIDQEKYELYQHSISSLERSKADFKKIESTIELLVAANKKQELSEEKKKLLLKSLHTKDYLRQQITNLQNKINELLPYIDNKVGSISASEVIRNGVKVLIGNAVLYIRDDIQNCKLVNNEGRVTVTAYL